MRPGWYRPPYTGRFQKSHRVSQTHPNLVVTACGKVFEADGIREITGSPAAEEKCGVCVKATS